MKKILLVLSALLCLLSFVSCEKDKSEEIISTYENFCETFMLINPIAELFPTEIGEKNLEGTSIDNEKLAAFLSSLYPGKEIDLTSDDNKFSLGAISIHNEENNKTSKITNATFTVSYNVEKEDMNKKEYKITSDSSFVGGEDSESVSLSYSLTMNGKDYKSITYTYNGEKFTAATAGGRDVSLRLLNASRLNPGISDGKTGTTE